MDGLGDHLLASAAFADHEHGCIDCGHAPDLAQHLLERFRQDRRHALGGFTEGALAALEAHPWPGNVRELANAVRRAVVMAQGRLVTAADLGLDGAAPGTMANALEQVRDEAERLAIESILLRSGRNVARSARELGVSRMTLYRLMAKHGIQEPRS